MNAVLKEAASPTRDLFDRLKTKAPALRASDAATRIAKLRRLLKATLDARPAILAAAKQELRLVDLDIDAQLLMVKADCEFICRHLEQWVQPEEVPPTLMTVGKRCFVQYEPKGVVLHLSTWNAPIAEALIPGFGAIAAGCPFLLKPSELAPHSAQVLADLIRGVLPEDEFAVVQGGPEVAQELLTLPFSHIFYIGGHTVGKIVLRAAAEHFASVTLEMGGKNPVIVGASADIADAAKKIAWGRVANAGQVCVAPDYALVHESVQRPFIEALGAAMARMYNADGKGYENSEYVPRIVNARHFERIKALLDDALAKGAKLEHGGQTRAEDQFIAPTILSGLRPDMRIMQDEIFGPIICVLPFRTREDAAREIATRPKPLSLYVFSRDRGEINWLLAHTTSGNGAINHNVIQAGTNPLLPFGGTQASGQGRLNGRFTFLECSNARSLIEDGPALPGVDPDMMFPPYSDKFKKNIDWMLANSPNPPVGVLRFLGKIARWFGKR
jgi:aldehyde dehydrogenase (NAD+)